MPNLMFITTGAPVARVAAQHILAQAKPLARAVVLVPTRRACVTMREAFQQELGGKASLLPRILPLADLENELMNLLGAQALPLLESLPIAMSDTVQRYHLTQLVAEFERERFGAVRLADALLLAEQLMALQDECTRAGVTLTYDALRPLAHADFATHWEQSLKFLAILYVRWPLLEQEIGLTLRSAREVRVLQALSEHWRTTPPDYPVYVVGSTASQEATAGLLHTIAELPSGMVMLPGLSAMDDAEWAQIRAGHPLYHLKCFLDRFPAKPQGEKANNLWLTVLADTAQLPEWKRQPRPDYAHVKLIPCQHAEEEARVIALLMREALERTGTRTALVTPDEGLMARVASHMLRYGVAVNRLAQGTLATTETGSLWAALLAAIANPEKLLLWRALLQHPLMEVDAALLREMEPHWHGLNRNKPGQLPRLPDTIRQHPLMPKLAALLAGGEKLSRSRLSVEEWIAECETLFAPFHETPGEAAGAVEEALEALHGASMLGRMEVEEFHALLAERLAQPWRSIGKPAHPQLGMLTPVEARLQQFDRVILGNMVDTQWPGQGAPNAWLNLAARKALGLPAPEERVSLMAHDLLMLGSGAEVFLTYPRRAEGAPTTRSRFIERLVTLLAAHGVDASAIMATEYIDYANALYAAAECMPESEVRPMPAANERPTRLPVSDLDALFRDPFAVYAKHVLGLKSLKEIDAEPSAADFGTIAHKAIEVLSKHWNSSGEAASPAQLQQICEAALADFSDRANIALFWRQRLLRALQYVNIMEAERRTAPMQMLTEEVVEAAIPLETGGSIALHGRIDRLEKRANGCHIIDYKTGEAPSDKDILNGKAVQLLAYAMILEANGETSAALEYWQLPRGRHEGALKHLADEDVNKNKLPEKLCTALASMLNPEMPFLAHVNIGEAQESDFDGISRYDEWAG